MTGPTHVGVSLAASIALARFNGLHISAIELLIIIVGSLAPDLDSNDGTLTKPGKVLRRFLPRGVANLIDGITQSIAGLINFIFGHRGFTHWPIFGVTLYLSGVIFQMPYLMWFGWAYLWHILADFCTKSSVPMYAPVSTKNVTWSPIATGTVAEVGIAIMVWITVAVSGWPLLPKETRYWLGRYYNFISEGGRHAE